MIRLVLLVPCAFVLAAAACEKAGPCPKEMAPIDGLKVCIDKWESSSARNAKGVLGPAVSKPGVIPTDSVAWVEADTSCRTAKKRLCTADEWASSCRGTEGRQFPYGKAFEPERCNTLQVGRKTGKTEKRPTGSLVGCDNGRGVMDLSGNVWEWTATPDQTGQLRQLWGGGFANDNDENELSCGFRKPLFQPPTQNHSGIGFRCCRDARQ